MGLSSDDSPLSVCRRRTEDLSPVRLHNLAMQGMRLT